MARIFVSGEAAGVGGGFIMMGVDYEVATHGPRASCRDGWLWCGMDGERKLSGMGIQIRGSFVIMPNPKQSKTRISNGWGSSRA